MNRESGIYNLNNKNLLLMIYAEYEGSNIAEYT